MILKYLRGTFLLRMNTDESGMRVEIWRSKSGTNHKLWAIVDTGRQSRWPRGVPEDVVGALLPDFHDPVLPNEIAASDGYRYRLLPHPAGQALLNIL